MSAVIAIFDKNFNSIRAFNPEDKTWTKLNDLTDNIVKIDSYSATVIDETIFIFADDKTNFKLKYTEPDAKWIQLPNRIATDYVLVVSFLGEVYAFHDSDIDSITIEKLNKEQTSWSQMTKSFPCYFASLVATEDHIYTFGGLDGNDLDRVARFDPTTETWSDLSAMPTARYGAGSAELNGKIYVIGGDGGDPHTVECFNIESTTWMALKSTNYDHYFFNACTLNGKIYAVGGTCSVDQIEEYDPNKEEWKIVDTMTGKAIYDHATITLIVS